MINVIRYTIFFPIVFIFTIGLLTIKSLWEYISRLWWLPELVDRNIREKLCEHKTNNKKAAEQGSQK